MTGTFLRLHSGGVVRNGSGALFVGPNGAGKSTLVVRLLNEGFDLIADDEVWIDPGSRLVHPSPRPVTLKGSAWDLFPAYRERFSPCALDEADGPAWCLEPEDIRPRCRAVPSPIRTLVFLDPRPGDGVVLEPIGQAEAVSLLLREAMNFTDLGSDGLRLIVTAVTSADLFRLRRGDLEACTRLLTASLP